MKRAFETVSAAQIANPGRALPFWLSLSLVPAVILAALIGGWALVLPPLASWGMFSLLDRMTGRYEKNADVEMPDDGLIWYRAITLIWFPVQASLLLGLLWYVPSASHLSSVERVMVFCGMGVVSGTVGINYAHELMHQQDRSERWLADLLLSTVFYGHFRSEHLLVHHIYVATPRDAVTARYNEGFHRFYPRVLRQVLISSWQAETARLARRGLPVWHSSNPFWRYGLLQLAWVICAFLLAGGPGVILFLVQAGVAIWQLELVNYIEHYGLTRKYLGDGKYEHVKPRHSWNATQKASNWLLINLQRHSDHHYKPARRFPLLQTYSEDDAPLLPYGYPMMTMAAMVPPIWLRTMNPRVRAWRRQFYPEIEDWGPYKTASNPMPR